MEPAYQQAKRQRVQKQEAEWVEASGFFELLPRCARCPTCNPVGG